jgi:hypothetical protein
VTTTHPLLSAALAAAARGWHVLPLTPGRKQPAIEAWEARATTDPDRIRACWTTGNYGLGIACGPSGLLVVDLDVSKPGATPPAEWRRAGIVDGRDVLAALCETAGQPWPDTHTVQTASGGLHLYYRQPDDTRLGNSHGRLGWLIDTRGHGGQVVAPGTTIAGRPYTVLDDRDPAPLPAWLAHRLTATGTETASTPPTVQLHTGRAGAYAQAALDTQTAHVRGAPEGQRNATLYMAAQNLGQLIPSDILDEPTARAALLAAAEPHIAAGAYTRREAQATITSGLRAGTRRPRQVSAA